MAFNQRQVEEVRDKLDRALALHLKQKAVKDGAKLSVDDNDDFAMSDSQLVLDYIASLRQKRDNLIAQIQLVVAAWAP